jgi:hypothetical protein
MNIVPVITEQSPYFPARNGDVLEIVGHQNMRLSVVVVSDILDSYHLPIEFYTLNHVKSDYL